MFEDSLADVSRLRGARVSFIARQSVAIFLNNHGECFRKKKNKKNPPRGIGTSNKSPLITCLETGLRSTRACKFKYTRFCCPQPLRFSIAAMPSEGDEQEKPDGNLHTKRTSGSQDLNFLYCEAPANAMATDIPCLCSTDLVEDGVFGGFFYSRRLASVFL